MGNACWHKRILRGSVKPGRPISVVTGCAQGRVRGRRVWHLALGLLMLLIFGCQLLPGTWRSGWNQEWPPDRPVPETAASWKLGERERGDGQFIGMALSGGGSRAANFSAAVMLELQGLGLLEDVDVISAVSGSALPAAYYGLRGKQERRFTEEAVRKALGYDFQSDWLWRWFYPHNAFRYWFTDFTRSDIMVNVFNAHLYEEATFGDFEAYPKILINATTHNDNSRFTFTDEAFKGLRSNLALYQIANAVNASSAFPGVFDDVTLESYPDQSRTDPPFPSQFLHLYDGGPVDNLGVQAVLEYLYRGVAGTTLDRLFPKGCAILVVDASPSMTDPALDEQRSSRTFADYFLNTNALDATDALLESARGAILNGLGIQSVDSETSGAVSIGGCCTCQVRHIALRHLLYLDFSDEALASDDLAEKVTRIKTKFSIEKEEQDDLFAAAKLLVKELGLKRPLSRSPGGARS